MLISGTIRYRIRLPEQIYGAPATESIMMEQFPQCFDLEVLWHSFSRFPDKY